MKKQLLVAVGDDEPMVCLTLKKWLEGAGHRAKAYEAPEEFRAGVREFRPDIALLDVIFRPEDGRDICKSMNQDPATRGIPVILISVGRREVEDIVEGLDSGAADYLLKPFERQFVLAKIDSVMRRFDAPRELAETLTHYGLSLDAGERRARVGRQDVPLTRMEFDLLAYLLRHPHQALSTRHLLEAVWGHEPETCDDPATVHVHVSRLRKKLGRRFSGRLATLINSGYRLD